MKLFGFCRIQFILRRILTQSHYQCKKQRVFQQILHTIQYSVGRFNKIFFVKLNFLCIDWWWWWLMLMLFCISVFRWQTTNKVLITFSASNQTLVRLLQSLPQLLVQHLREKVWSCHILQKNQMEYFDMKLDVPYSGQLSAARKIYIEKKCNINPGMYISLYLVLEIDWLPKRFLHYINRFELKKRKWKIFRILHIVF